MTQKLTCIALLVVALLATALTSTASALTDAEELTAFGSVVPNGSDGSAAGEVYFPAAIAADPVTGHVYVGGHQQRRINEFTPWGEFIKAFGWDVAPGAVNEQQEVRIRASDGQFKLGFSASTTVDLPFNADAAEITTALNSLATIGGAGGSVEVTSLAGNAATSTPYVFVITFKGSLAGTDVAQLSASNGTTPLGGGKPLTSLEVRTRADGTPGGTGLEACTAESGCKAGLAGQGPGQVGAFIWDLSVDANGHIYAATTNNKRVQKFSPTGHFLLMIGGEVNKTTGENLCTAASGDECGAAVSGTSQGQFSQQFGGIGIGPTGSLYVGDSERIQRFNSGGEFESELKIPGESVSDLTVDPKTGALYAGYGFPKENVHKLDPVTGAEIGQLKVHRPQDLAADLHGNIYVIDPLRFEGGDSNPDNHPARVLEFNPSGNQVASLAGPTKNIELVRNIALRAVGTGPSGNLYVARLEFLPEGAVESKIHVYGPPPVTLEPPPRRAPTVSAQYAISVGTDYAVVKAEINPHFWPDATYTMQYGTAECFESGWVSGCKEAPLPPALLTGKAVKAPLTTAGVLLSDLKPGTSYRYRFIAQSSGGGPVRGVGGTEEEDGAEATFTTFALPTPPQTDCPNQAFRTAASAKLPDCRAYEMVTPVDKNNGDILALGNINADIAALDESAASGQKLTYSTYKAFGDATSSPFSVQYIADRGKEGWSNRTISPPRGISVIGLETFDVQFRAFSEDLCSGWLVHDTDPLLAPDAQEGFANLYKSDLCGTGGYEALTTGEPLVIPSFSVPDLQGVSADGAHAVFRRLEGTATKNSFMVYYVGGGEVHRVCVLPNGNTHKSGCSAGTTASAGSKRAGSVSHAISDDGSRIFWTASSGGKGPIYVRKNPAQPQSSLSGGKCTEAEMACTVAIGEGLFWTATPDGSTAIYQTNSGELNEFEVEEEKTNLIAKGVKGLLGTSEDATRIYLVSTEVLSADPGPEGKAAVSEEPNLYLYETSGENFDFVATLGEGDIGSAPESPSPISPQPYKRLAKVSADGSHAIFMSAGQPTGYDNTDVNSGEADAEVYLYDTDASGSAGTLTCVSCNPTGARPSGAQLRNGTNRTPLLWAAAQIPTGELALYSPRVLSSDGGRLFFESFEALVPHDTNGKQDVYEWEAPGKGSCTESSPSYSPPNGGCLGLISSGESPKDSAIVDADADGANVFIRTAASLLPQDPGLIDIYDARIGGGFPPRPLPPAACEGEACQGPPAPPNDPTPASSAGEYAGNVKEGTPRPRCGKAKVRRRGRCVAKRPKRQRNANHKRGSTR